jgi:hypothetical protein
MSDTTPRTAPPLARARDTVRAMRRGRLPRAAVTGSWQAPAGAAVRCPAPSVHTARRPDRCCRFAPCAGSTSRKPALRGVPIGPSSPRSRFSGGNWGSATSPSLPASARPTAFQLASAVGSSPDFCAFIFVRDRGDHGLYHVARLRRPVGTGVCSTGGMAMQAIWLIDRFPGTPGVDRNTGRRIAPQCVESTGTSAEPPIAQNTSRDQLGQYPAAQTQAGRRRGDA